MKIMKRRTKKEAVINKDKDKKIIEIMKEENNNICFDCQNLNPKYISLYNGIFICQKCMNNIHKKYDSNISFILENKLNNLSIRELQYLYYGGNQKLKDFINYDYPNLKSIDKNKLYLTKGMEYYRLYLKYLIDSGEKPLKPSYEESVKLINDINKSKNNEHLFNKNKRNLINKDFINYYENDQNEIDYNYKTNHHYNKIYKINLVNYLNNSKTNNCSTIKQENELCLGNNLNIDKNNNNNDFNKKTIDLEKYNDNINNNNKNKLITKKLSLKKNKNLVMKNKNNIISINKTLNDSLPKKKIYIKPKHTLLKSFQKNAPSRNIIDNFSNIGNSLFIPTGNNYQSILINNNNFDKLLMYNFTESSNNSKDNIKLNESLKTGWPFLNSMKVLKFPKNNGHRIFKKKTLKNSFSINKRKIKHSNNNSIIERTNFQIISDKIHDDILEISKHKKMNSIIANYKKDINKKEDIKIISEIKVKKKTGYNIGENKPNILLDSYNSHKNIKSEENINSFPLNTNLTTLKNSSKNLKENKIKKILTLAKLMKNKKKILITKLNLDNNNNKTFVSHFNDDKNNRIYESYREREKSNGVKNIYLTSRIGKKKKNIIEKKVKEIILLKNNREKVKPYKNENNNIKANNELKKKINKTKKNIFGNINQIKKNENINKEKYSDYQKAPQTYRQKEIFNN